MRKFATRLLPAVLIGGLWGGAAFAEDLSVLGQWTGKYPAEKNANDKSLWEQPGIQAVMRAAMGEHFFALFQKGTHDPEAPVASDGKGMFVAWSCNERDDCGGNNITVFFDTIVSRALVCWRSSDGDGGKVQDLWLVKGEVRQLPINGCGVGERDPFASLKRNTGAGEGKKS